MECKFIREHLFDYLDNELSPGEKTRFETHLGTCADCARLLEEFRTLHNAIGSGKKFEPDPYAGTRILSRIEKELDQKEPVAGHGFARILQPVILSLTILLAAWIGFTFASYRESQSEKPKADINLVKTELHIADFTGEDKLLLLNP